MKTRIKIPTLLLVALLANGCGTVTPDAVHRQAGSHADDVPPQYREKFQNSSGFLGWLDKNHAIYTGSAIAYYEELIADYRLQYEADYATPIHPGDGVEPYIDQWRNSIWKMDVGHKIAFERMAGMRGDHRPPDTLWMKAKDKLTP